MRSERTNPATDISATLAELCEKQLRRELSQFQNALEALQQARTALGAGQPEALASVVQESHAAAGLFESAQADRKRFCAQVAAMTGADAAAVTLGKTIDQLPAAMAAPLQAQRSTLRHLLAQVERVTHANARIIWWRLDFIKQVFAGLPGVSGSGRYGQEGRLQTSTCGLLLQGNG
jgi:hypothetical protein